MADKADVLRQLVDVLRKDHPAVKECLYQLEVFLRVRSERAVYELRDAFDHIAHLHAEDTDATEAQKDLNEIQTHLRRAAVEPMEYLAEQAFLKAERILNGGFWWWSVLLLKKPSPAEQVRLNRELTDVGMLIAKGREKKAAREALPVLRVAFERAQGLLDRLNPRELRSRIYGGVLVLVGLLLTLTITGLRESVPALDTWARDHAFLFALLVAVCIVVAVPLLLCVVIGIRKLWQKVAGRWGRRHDRP